MGKSETEHQKLPRLNAWNGLLEEVKLPADFSVALSCGRQELLGAIRRPLTAEETAMVAHAMGILIETNVALQQHAAGLADLARHFRQLLMGADSKLNNLIEFAEFRDLETEDD